MKASPASTLRNTRTTQRIKSSPAGERKTENVLYSVFRKPPFLIHIYSPLSKSGYTVQATVSKPVSESPFHYVPVSLSFRTVVSMKGGSYDFRVTLTRPHPLEAHLSHAAGQQGVEGLQVG